MSCPGSLHSRLGDKSSTRKSLSLLLSCGQWWLSSTYHISSPQNWETERAIYKPSGGNFNRKEVRLISDLRLPSQLSLVILHMLAWHFPSANLILKSFVSFTLKWKVSLWLESPLPLLKLQFARVSLICTHIRVHFLGYRTPCTTLSSWRLLRVTMHSFFCKIIWENLIKNLGE
jgi:hypothetical protein